MFCTFRPVRSQARAGAAREAEEVDCGQEGGAGPSAPLDARITGALTFACASPGGAREGARQEGDRDEVNTGINLHRGMFSPCTT